MAFRRATKFESKARILLVGPAKSGKSRTALEIASGLGARVAAIDTEHGSLSKYADRFVFDVDEPGSFDTLEYVRRIEDAARAGYDALVIDSLSHAWMGRGGILEQLDEHNSKDKFTKGWGVLSPKHTALIEAMHAAPMHIIATARTKMEYVLEKDEDGKNKPRKVGLAPVQRDGLEYEFDFVGTMDAQHRMHVGESRIDILDNITILKPTAEVGRDILGWLAGERRKAPWENVQFLIGELTGTLVSEAAVGTIGRYLEAVRNHIKRNPELSREERETWINHGVICAQAQEAAKRRELQTTPSNEETASGK